MSERTSTSYAEDPALRPDPTPGWDDVHHVLRNVIGMTYGAAQQAIWDYRATHGDGLVRLAEPANRTAYVTAAHVYAFTTRELPREAGDIIAEHERKAWHRLQEAQRRVKDAEKMDNDLAIREARHSYAWYQSAWGALHNLRKAHTERAANREENDDE
jgi:hypothetical protein